MTPVREIIRTVADKHGLSPGQLISRSTRQNVSLARREAMYEARRQTTKSYPVIARAFQRHHTTVIHAVRLHAERMGIQ